jgi:methyl-accepting chemotaxis protein
MTRTWTFGQKLGAGFAVMVVLAVGISLIAVASLRGVVASLDRVIAVNAQSLIDCAKLDAASEWKVAAGRGYLLTRDERFLERMRLSSLEFSELLGRLRAHMPTDEARKLVVEIERADAEYQSALERVVTLRKNDSPMESILRKFEEDVTPRRYALDKLVTGLVAREERALEEARGAAAQTASSAITLVVTAAIGALLFALVIALVLTRALTRQIGSAVQHVQSSSTELQTAANQQAMGAKEQSTAMSEITTTISELLATSRQITESARRVAQIAEQTASGARAGDDTVARASESIAGIRRQVDVIVGHMLDLGRKSQQIGGILEVINELAEQTNILALNAAIEAAGAGDSGRRFAVVADEIRKLADRVGGSTKEIRGLIEEVRAAVNTTVMATESGSKTVDAGARQFADVTTAFKQIGALVGTTTEAAREIELSTKQQTSAVEQVNVAVANVAQTTRETEASSNQTYQTASQLTLLSRDLTRLIQPTAGA